MKKISMKIREYPLIRRTLKTSEDRFCNLVMPILKSFVMRNIKIPLETV
jgi:hypothetical protein